MDHMEKRRELARLLDENEERRKNVNSIPAVIAARAATDTARSAYDAAHKNFDRVFHAHYGQGDGDLIDAHPDAVVLGMDMEPEFRWIARCAVTKLPIFYGDKVHSIGHEDGYRVYILADAVQAAPGFEAYPKFLARDDDAED